MAATDTVIDLHTAGDLLRHEAQLVPFHGGIVSRAVFPRIHIRRAVFLKQIGQSIGGVASAIVGITQQIRRIRVEIGIGIPGHITRSHRAIAAHLVRQRLPGLDVG